MSDADGGQTDHLLAVLRTSHDRLESAVGSLAGPEVSDRSYCDDWSIAQVLSHLGSGAEIFTLFLEAGSTGTATPGIEQMQPIWDRWNAMEPAEQVSQGLSTDAAFLDEVDAMDAPQRESWQMSFFGSDQSLDDVLLLRLGEHTLHTWDAVVALDPAATLEPSATEVLVDGLPLMVSRYGKGSDRPVRAQVTTTSPEHHFLLEVDAEGVRLSPAGPATTNSPGATVTMPAEALIRLAAGRLDPDHTPPIETSDLDLDDLRRAFPGV